MLRRVVQVLVVASAGMNVGYVGANELDTVVVTGDRDRGACYDKVAGDYSKCGGGGDGESGQPEGDGNQNKPPDFKSPGEVEAYLKKLKEEKAKLCEAKKQPKLNDIAIEYTAQLANCGMKANSSFGITISILGGVTVPAHVLKSDIYKTCAAEAKSKNELDKKNAGVGIEECN
jgi:hypothetical protein